MTVKNNEAFFNDISSFYDEMTGFKTAIERRKKALSRFMNESVKTVADLGSGSGLDSISLALMGRSVTAFEQSEGMIEAAKRNASSVGLDITFIKKSLDRIPASFSGKFDAAFSLGNTLANLPLERLSLALRKAQDILKDKGTFIIQVLNFNRILKENERIINITEMNDVTYIRFYDFLPESLNFNILKFRKDNPSERKLYTTRLYPHTKDIFSELLKDSGFRKINYYGSLELGKFIKYTSKDLVIIAQK